MPVYEYIDVKTGRTVEFAVPIVNRDKIPGHKRITVPRRLHVVLGAPDPTDADQAVPRALHELEDTMNHRQIAREAGFTTEQLKHVWKM